MNVRFYAAAGNRFDECLVAAWRKGVSAAGDSFERRDSRAFAGVEPDTDLAVSVGVKSTSKNVFDAHRAAGRHAAILDKGYDRLHQPPGRSGPRTLYFRVSFDALQPHAYFRRTPRPSDRFLRLGAALFDARRRPLRRGEVVFCGGSKKYCDWHGLGEANAYARAVLEQLRRHTDRPLVYRPKPGWKSAMPVAGSRFSTGRSFADELNRAHCIVTFGSNAAYEAMRVGVPVIVLGDGIARSLARTRVENVEDPLRPDPARVAQLAYDASYCQYTRKEFADPVVWRSLKETVQSLDL